MRWSTTWSPSISLRRATGVCFLAGFLALGLLPAAAQDVEQRYQQAIELFNKPDMEGACELLQQLEPGYKQTKMYMNMACSQVKRLITMEENLFNEGVQFFNQGDYGNAKQKFEAAAKVALKNPKHRSDVSRFLKQIDARENEERLFQEGVRAFNEKRYAEAQSRLSQVAQGGGPKAAQARNYLAQVQAELRKQAAATETNRLFDDGVRLMNAGNNVDALTNFEKVVQAGGPNAAAAQTYIQRLRQISQPPPPRPTPEKKEVAVSKPPVKPTPSRPETAPRPETPTPVASEQTLRAGLQAYFQGNLEDAERSLSDYLSNNGQKQALAYFFRGAAHSTRYFLSGETDSQQKELAVADFHALKQRAGQFQPPQKKYVSPKILALYSEAVGAP
jgi:outer membrane protein assembly factor BamD (BamD/ComL family)